MQYREFTNKELISMVKRLHHDNERDIVDAIRGDASECVNIHKIHERNNIIHMLLQKVKL